MILKKLLIMLFVIILSGAANPVFSMESPSEIFIIVNKSVSDSSLSERDVKNIFLGKKIKWSNNEPLVFVVMTLVFNNCHRFNIFINTRIRFA